MFNLIDESGKDLSQYGYSVRKLPKAAATLAYLDAREKKKAEELGFDRGEYFIINAENILESGDTEIDYLAGVVANALKRLFESCGQNRKGLRLMVVGLGNPDILADSLGKAVVDFIDIDGKENVFKFCPNIYALTNIKTFDFVKMIKEGVNADVVILIDALATNEITRLGTSIQITSAGITPGSGVNSGIKKICEKELKVPCISIGVPFMLFASALTQDSPDDLLLTPKDIHENVDMMGYIIGDALNKIL